MAFSDTFPTGTECGTLNANVRPRKSLAIIRAGPVGLATMIIAKLYSPIPIVVIDIKNTRLKRARRLGANKTINTKLPGAIEDLESFIGGRGFDSIIEVVGTLAIFDLYPRLLTLGGSLANIGVHGHNVVLNLNEL